MVTVMQKKKRQQFLAAIFRDLGMDEDVISAISGLSKQDLQQK